MGVLSSWLPSWAPNVHPLVVHLPIGLLVAAVAVDVLGLVLRGNAWLRGHATFLYVLGTLAAITAYFTGRAAAHTVWLPGMAHAVVKEHWDLAFRTVWFFGVLTLLRLVLLRPATGPTTRKTARKGASHPAIVAGLVLAGLVGLVLLAETGDLGGRLVYQHGVGTSRE